MVDRVNPFDVAERELTGGTVVANPFDEAENELTFPERYDTTDTYLTPQRTIGAEPVDTTAVTPPAAQPPPYQTPETIAPEYRPPTALEISQLPKPSMQPRPPESIGGIFQGELPESIQRAPVSGLAEAYKNSEQFRTLWQYELKEGRSPIMRGVIRVDQPSPEAREFMASLIVEAEEMVRDKSVQGSGWGTTAKQYANTAYRLIFKDRKDFVANALAGFPEEERNYRRDAGVDNLKDSGNLTERLMAKQAEEIAKYIRAGNVPLVVSAVRSYVSTAFLGMIPTDPAVLPEQQIAAGAGALAAFLTTPAGKALFRPGVAAAGKVGGYAVSRSAVATRLVNKIAAMPIASRLAAIPVEFVKLKAGSLAYSLLTPENFLRISRGEDPLAVFSDHIQQAFEVDGTTALYAIAFGLLKGLPKPSKGGPTPEQQFQNALQKEAARRLGLPEDASVEQIQQRYNQHVRTPGAVRPTVVTPAAPKPPTKALVAPAPGKPPAKKVAPKAKPPPKPNIVPFKAWLSDRGVKMGELEETPEGRAQILALADEYRGEAAQAAPEAPTAVTIAPSEPVAEKVTTEAPASVEAVEKPTEAPATPAVAPGEAPLALAEGKKAFGADNTLFTKPEADAAAERLKEAKGKDFLSDETGAVDPKRWVDAIKVGGYYFEAGVRSFRKWATRMVSKFGQAIKGSLKKIWNAVRGSKEGKQVERESIVKDLAKQLKKGFKTQQKAREELALKQAKERGKRSRAMHDEFMQKYRAEGYDAFTAMNMATKELAGELVGEEDIPEGLRPKLTDEQWAVLNEHIVNELDKPRSHFTMKNAIDALNKVKRGAVLQPNEINLLDELFGLRLAHQLRRQTPLSDRVVDLLAQSSGLPVGIVAAGEVSYMFRQHLPALWEGVGASMHDILRLRNPSGRLTPWATSSWNMLAGYFSESRSKEIQEELRNHPLFDVFMAHGGEWTEWGPTAKAQDRPEVFQSRFLDLIPLVKRSVRATVVGGNALRMLSFADYFQRMVDAGRVPTNQDLTDFADMTGDISGRPTLHKAKKLRRMFSALANLFWSPRFYYGRAKNILTGFGALNKRTLKWESPKRTAAIHRLVGGMSCILGLWALGRVIGYWDIGLDPDKGDFGVARIGNTRYDLTGGYRTVMAFFLRLWRGEYRGADGKLKPISTTEVIEKELKNKLSPLPVFLRTLAYDEDWEGKKVEGAEAKAKEAYNLFTFLFIQDTIEVFKEESKKSESTLGPAIHAAFAGMASAVGIGVNAYDDPAVVKLRQMEDAFAQEMFKQNFGDLAISQQYEVREKHDKKLNAMQIEVWKEQSQRKDPGLDRLILKERDAGKEVVALLSPESQTVMTWMYKNAGYTLTISQRAGQWRMNESQFKKYKALTAMNLDKFIAQETTTEYWNSQSDFGKRQIFERVVEAAKKEARGLLMEELEEAAENETKGG